MGTHYEHLSLEERCTIAGLRWGGHSLGQIAAALDRPTSTISRELSRNSGAHGYRAGQADSQAWARRWRGSRMERQPALRQLVLDRLAMGWSPEQIAGRLALEHSSMRISHESIYRFIDAQIRRSNDYSWRHYLPRAKSRRGRPRLPPQPLVHIKHRISIEQRPKHVQTRRQCGHWEADLLHPRKSGAAILVAQERTSRFILLAKQPGKHAQLIVDRIKRWFTVLPPTLRRSLTQDNGPEFREHHQLNLLGVETYFCHPHSPWQKGGIENANGRIRRYIPRGTDPRSFSDADLQALAQRLNRTPRKCIGFKTPAELFSSQLLHLKCESTFPLSRE